MSVLLAFLSLLIERFAGYPEPLLKAIGHPVTWIGGLVGWLDRTFNREEEPEDRRRRNGIVAALRSSCSAGAGGCRAGRHLLADSPGHRPRGHRRHQPGRPAQPRGPCRRGRRCAGERRRSWPAARRCRGSSAAIPSGSTRPASPRAAIESLAENFSDGVVAPAFWLAVGGLAGGAAYKAVNTADSMIGHRTPRHQAFGWAVGAARRSRQPARLAPVGAADRLRGGDPAWRLGGRGLAASWSATPAGTARPTPAGPRRRWPARSAWRSPGRASTAARRWPTPSWAGAAGAKRPPRTSAGRSASTGWPT